MDLGYELSIHTEQSSFRCGQEIGIIDSMWRLVTFKYQWMAVLSPIGCLLSLSLSLCRSILPTVLTLIRSWLPFPPPSPTWSPLTETCIWKDSNSPSTPVKTMPPSLDWPTKWLLDGCKKSHAYVSSTCTLSCSVYFIPHDTLLHSD